MKPSGIEMWWLPWPFLALLLHCNGFGYERSDGDDHGWSFLGR